MSAPKDTAGNDLDADVKIIDDGDIIEIAPSDPSRQSLTQEEVARQLETARWGQLKNDPNCVEVRVGLKVLGRLPFCFD